MTINEYAKLVNEIRTAQKDFFRTRSESALEKSKKLERRVDEATRDIFDSRQGRLFE